MIDIKRSRNSNIRDFGGEKLIFNSFTVTISGAECETFWHDVVYKFTDDVPTTEDLRRILEEVIETGIYHIAADPGKRFGISKEEEE